MVTWLHSRAEVGVASYLGVTSPMLRGGCGLTCAEVGMTFCPVPAIFQAAKVAATTMIPYF